MGFATIDELEAGLHESGYLPDRGLATSLFLSLTLEKPLLLEGEAGVGKTEAGKALATALGARLIRLQCYEGLDIAHAVYEWNYLRQLLRIRAAQEGTVTEDELFGREFLIRRPLLEAIESEEPVVLADRRDRPRRRRVRGLPARGALRLPDHHPRGRARSTRSDGRPSCSRRTARASCTTRSSAAASSTGSGIPSLEREIEIVRLRVPGIPEQLALQTAAFVHGLRGLDLAKPPGVAETIDWAQALAALGRDELDAAVVEDTLGSVLKYHEDLELVRDSALAALVEQARAVRAS